MDGGCRWRNLGGGQCQADSGRRMVERVEEADARSWEADDGMRMVEAGRRTMKGGRRKLEGGWWKAEDRNWRRSV